MTTKSTKFSLFLKNWTLSEQKKLASLNLVLIGNNPFVCWVSLSKVGIWILSVKFCVNYCPAQFCDIFVFFSTRPSPGLLPVLGPLGGGTDAMPTKPCPKALGLLVITGWTSSSEDDASPVWEKEVDTDENPLLQTPYLDGIRTHRGRVKSVIRPPLNLQATMAVFLWHILRGKKMSAKTCGKKHAA